MRAVIDLAPQPGMSGTSRCKWTFDDGASAACATAEHHRDSSALVRMGDVPFRTAGNEGQAFLVTRHFRRRSKKARSVVALRRVPR
jgi:hypothetical protein